MGLFTWIAIGAFVGWIANYFMDQEESLFLFRYYYWNIRCSDC